MNTFPPREIVERLRLQYPAGCRVELVSMDDPYARLKPGDQGTVVAVDDIGTVHINWDNGSGLGAAPFTKTSRFPRWSSMIVSA